MTAREPEVVATAAALRRMFDRTFADPPPPEAPPMVDFLAIGIGADPWAIKLSEISGLFMDRQIAPLPGATVGLLGLMSLRGALLPVYDLRAFLGYSGGALPRCVLTAVDAPVALAFDRFEGHLRVPRTALPTDETTGAPALLPAAHDVVHAGGSARSIVRLASVLDAIATRSQQNAHGAE